MAEDVIGEAFGILLRIGGGALVWVAARHFTTEYEPIARASALGAYGRVALACVIVAFLAWGTYGTHVEDPDPLFGGGEVVHDFAPSEAERNRRGLVTLLVLLTLAGHGTWYGRTHRRELWFADEAGETEQPSLGPSELNRAAEGEHRSIARKYGARCARLVPEPPTTEISRYASYGRGQCPTCMTSLADADDS